MNLKNAAILLFACAIVSAFGDLVTNLERLDNLLYDVRAAFFTIVSLLVDVAFLLAGKAFYNRSATLQTVKTPGILLTIACSLWVLYYCWLLGERMIHGALGDMAYDYYSWMCFTLFHSVTSLFLGIAIVSGQPARIRMAGLLACIGAGAWTAWLLFLLLTRVDSLLYAADDPIRALKMFADFALPAGVFFFGMALYRSQIWQGKREEVIDQF